MASVSFARLENVLEKSLFAVDDLSLKDLCLDKDLELP